MGSNEEDHQVSEVLLQLGRVLYDEQTVDRILQLVTALTERTVRSASAASVTLVGKKGAFTSNASATIARELDEVQYRADDGPCLTALRERRTINAKLSEVGGRWSAFAAAAKESGIGSSLSVPLTIQERSLGGLNIYSADERIFDETEEQTALLLAQQAAAVLANAFAFADVGQLNSQLAEALETRDLIGQAKGIIMAREGCDSHEAFDVLRRASQRTNRKLRDIAAELVASAPSKRGDT